MPVTLGHPLLDIVARCVVIYLTLFVGLRLMGKRQVGQLTPFDLLLLLLLSNAVQNAMIGEDTSLLGGLIAAVSLFGLNFLVARVARTSGAAAKLREGSPTLLIRDGDFLEANLAHEGISRSDILRALREHGVDDPSTVRSAILEVDGTISVLRSDDIAPVPKPYHRIRGIPRHR
jgi:uncharacterized membrane protein YcaP (DUF421 family)